MKYNKRDGLNSAIFPKEHDGKYNVCLQNTTKSKEYQLLYSINYPKVLAIHFYLCDTIQMYVWYHLNQSH